MRIIAGTHRGRTLLGPEGDDVTRPITDRVKENLFNRLHSLGVIGYGRVLDVFAGTGSMGLEALSRGATHCTFCLLYTSPSPRDQRGSRMPSSA